MFDKFRSAYPYYLITAPKYKMDLPQQPCMGTIESAQPNEEAIESIQELLLGNGPLSHREIVSKSSFDDSEVQRALNELWREGVVYHTLDRKFDLKEDS